MDGKIVSCGIWRDDCFEKPYPVYASLLPTGHALIERASAAAAGDDFLLTPEGNFYFGSINRHQLPHGRGKLFHSDGLLCLYDGEWKDGAPHGEGVQRYVDRPGEEYRGAFADGCRCGQGVLTFADGSCRIGTWSRG
jgi:hypothetical protein